MKRIHNIILLFSLWGPTCLYAQQYYFNRYTTAEGLVQSTVKEIFQDSKGRMWFGTQEGVSIYDGSGFKNYGVNEGIKNPAISSFLELKPGLLLVGTQGSGAVLFLKRLFDRDTILFIIDKKEYIINPHIHRILKDNDNNIWFCTAGGITIWYYENNSYSRIEHISSIGNAGSVSVYDILFEDNGKIFYGTEAGLLIKENGEFQLAEHSKLKREPVFKIFSHKDDIWFLTLTEIYRLRKGEIKALSELYEDIVSPVTSIEQDAKGTLYLGSLNRIYRINKDKLDQIDYKSGITEKNIISLFVDREENLWIGSLEGVSKLSYTGFMFLNKMPEVNLPRLVKRQDMLFLCTSRGLYRIENYKAFPFLTHPALSGKRINDFDLSGHKYLFATENGLIEQNGQKLKVYNTSGGLPHNFVYSIEKDSNGTTWIATQGGLAYLKNDYVYNFKNQKDQSWFFSDDKCKEILSNSSIRHIVKDKKGNLWISSWDGGVFRITGKHIYRFTEKDGLTDLRIRGLYSDNTNRIWIGTRFGGVYIYDGKSFNQYTTKDGLSSNWVFSVIQDNENNYWLTTANGISKFDGRSWYSYDAGSGITTGEILFSCNYKGDLWFNSWDQVFYYQKSFEKKRNAYPNIYFTSISVLDQPVRPVNPVRFADKFDLSILNQDFRIEDEVYEFDYNNNYLSLEFATSEFKDEKGVSYRYVLEGPDNSIPFYTKRNFVSFSHLPAGKYKFSVYAINSSGSESPLPATFAFTILPPFWLTWWFITLIIALSAALVSGVTILLYRMKIRSLLSIERMRGDIASDLHDAVGTGLSGISIYSQIAKRTLSDNSKSAGDYLKRIDDEASSLIEKMSDIVWAINPDNDTLKDAVFKVKDYARNILEAAEIQHEVRFSDDAGEVNLSLEFRRNLILIIREAVTNAVKYSGAGKMLIDITVLKSGMRNKPSALQLTLSDDGKGFNTNQNSMGNGLKNIVKRAELLKGKAVIISSCGKGTKITVIAPVE